MIETAAPTMAARLYRDPAVYEQERVRVFAASWQLMGHLRELAAPGDYIAGTIAGCPLLVVRRDDGGLSGFHNVCRHRAGPLVTDENGSCGRELVCKYHGWAYTLDGRLKRARDFGRAEGFNAGDWPLFPVDVATWDDLVFVSIAEPGQPLPVFLSPLIRRMAGRDLGHLVPAGRRTHDIACNWKIYVENYLEGYHVPAVHPALNAEIESGDYRVVMDGAIAIHEVPVKAAKKGEAVYDGLWAWVWPNLGVNIYAHGLMLERILPAGLGRTRLVYDYYLKPGIAADASETAKVIGMSDVVTAEDKWICERVQENIDADVYAAGVLSPRHENGVQWFQHRLREALSGG